MEFTNMDYVRKIGSDINRGESLELVKHGIISLFEEELGDIENRIISLAGYNFIALCTNEEVGVNGMGIKYFDIVEYDNVSDYPMGGTIAKMMQMSSNQEFYGCEFDEPKLLKVF